MVAAQTDAALLPGFADPVRDSQRAFRAVLDAMANPGRIVTLPTVAEAPLGLASGTVAVALTLLDFETPLWLPAHLRGAAAESYLVFHCSCPIVDNALDALLAVITDPAAMPPLSGFAPGADQFPERSATLIIQVEGLRGGAGWRLTGPGVKGTGNLGIDGLPGGFATGLRANTALYPLGLDFIFTCGDKLAALPRTTRVEG